MTKGLICGGRSYGLVPQYVASGEPYAIARIQASREKYRLIQVLDAAHKRLGLSIVIHGDATGADRLARDWARERLFPEIGYPVVWRDDGTMDRGAGPKRNALMLSEHPDIEFVIAFQGARGTEDMCNKAHKKGIRVIPIDWRFVPR